MDNEGNIGKINLGSSTQKRKNTLYNFDETSSVDAIDYSFNSAELILYFFEFKNYDLYDTFFDAKKQLERYITDIDQCVFSCCYPKNLRKIKKN